MQKLLYPLRQAARAGVLERLIMLGACMPITEQQLL